MKRNKIKLPKRLPKVLMPLTRQFCVVLSLTLLPFIATKTLAEEFTQEHKQWLQQQFGEQHKNLIPIVAVADMYFACNQQRKVDPRNQSLASLVTQVDKNQLANKLMRCLGEDKIKSDEAINFGLLGCFHQQLSGLPEQERAVKMALVEKAIVALSREERQQSFTRCVNAQAMHYLK